MTSQGAARKHQAHTFQLQARVLGAIIQMLSEQRWNNVTMNTNRPRRRLSRDRSLLLPLVVIPYSRRVQDFVLVKQSMLSRYRIAAIPVHGPGLLYAKDVFEIATFPTPLAARSRLQFLKICFMTLPLAVLGSSSGSPSSPRNHTHAGAFCRSMVISDVPSRS